MRRMLVAAVTVLTTAAVVSGAAVADASPSRPTASLRSTSASSAP